MSRESRLVLILLLVTAAITLVAVPLQARWLWGLNHLLYLSTWATWLAAALAAILFVIILLGAVLRVGSQTSAVVVEQEFHLPIIISAVIAIVAGVGFWFLRGGFGILGDGSGIIAEFREGAAYYRKITEIGAYVLTRWVMTFTQSSSEPVLTAFRTVAVLSGIIAVFFQLRIAGLLARNIREFLIFAATLVFSGVALVYCGYVEFYAPVWAATTAFLYMALGSVLRSRTIFWPIALWIVACSMHLVAIVFGPAVLYLLLNRRSEEKKIPMGAKVWIGIAVMTAIGMTVGALALTWSGLDVSRILIPLWSRAGSNTPYGLITAKHIVDLGNLLVLCYPGSMALLGILYLKRKDVRADPPAIFLILCSTGSIAFLVLVDPALGMARDWDLMSLTLLAPIVLVLYLISKARASIGRYVAAGYVASTLIASGLFVAVYQDPASTAGRQLDLLKRYGDKDRGGWSILISFEALHNQDELAAETISEMDRFFPNYRLLRLATNAMRERKLDSALSIAQQLVRNDSTQGDFLQILGAAYSLRGDFSQAQIWYERAVAAKPIPPIMKELGAIYFMQSKYERAYDLLNRAHASAPNSSEISELLAQAAAHTNRLDRASTLVDSLLLTDSTSATAHLLGLDICLQRGDTTGARWHYHSYLKYAAPGPDDEAMIKQYEFLR